MARKEYKVGYVEVPIDQLVKANWNYKEEDESLSQKLEANIKRNGQIENILVRLLDTGYYEVVNGNHRVDVLKKLGHESVMTYNFGAISQRTAQRIAIETNETKFKTNLISLSELIKDILEEVDADDLVLTLPYSASELDNLLSITDYDAEGAMDDAGLPRDEMEKFFNITIQVNESVMESWEKWKARCQDILGYDNEFKCFEFAIAEALNIPKESLG